MGCGGCNPPPPFFWSDFFFLRKIFSILGLRLPQSLPFISEPRSCDFFFCREGLQPPPLQNVLYPHTLYKKLWTKCWEWFWLQTQPRSFLKPLYCPKIKLRFQCKCTEFGVASNARWPLNSRHWLNKLNQALGLFNLRTPCTMQYLNSIRNLIRYRPT